MFRPAPKIASFAKRSRVILLLISLVLITGARNADARIFTGRTGTPVEAEVVSVSLATSTSRLRLPNGKEADVPFANVSEADQAYLRQWKPPLVEPTKPPAPAPKTSPDPRALAPLVPGKLAANTAPLGAPGETIVIEFPELSKDRQGAVSVCKIRLPDQYDSKKPMPLLLWIGPGEGSNDPQGGRSLVDSATWAIAAMPYPNSAPTPRHALGKGQMPIIREYHMAMLKKLTATVPNVDQKLRFVGGLSNGAHCVATYMAEGEREFIDYFKGFIIIEGGCLSYKAKKKLRNSYAYVAWGDADGNSEGYMAGTRAMLEDGKLKVTSRVMPGVGHGFPDSEQSEVKSWIEKTAAPGLAASKP